MIRVFFVLLLLLLISVPCLAEYKEEFPYHLSYLSEELVPYNYLENDRATGISVEVLNLIWNELGEPSQRVRFLPWARAYDEALHKPGKVLFTTIRTPSRENKFKWVGPIAQFKISLMGLKKNKFNIKSDEEVRTLNVGAVTGYAAVDLLKALHVRRLDQLTEVDLHIQKLISGRIDALALEEGHFWQRIKKLNMDPSIFEPIYTLKALQACYAFNIKTPDSTIQRFQEALNRVRKSPEYQALIRKYFP